MEELKETDTVAKKQPNLLIIGGVVVAILLVGLGIYVNSGRSSHGIPQNQLSENTDQVQSQVAGVTDVMEDQEDSNTVTVEIEAGSFYYNPKEIRVKVGDKVRIVLTSKDMMHDLNIDELEVDGPVTVAGETSVIEFNANEAGEFEYYCSVGNHRTLGQVGTLFVEE
jgi:plastocyanin